MVFASIRRGLDRSTKESPQGPTLLPAWVGVASLPAAHSVFAAGASLGPGQTFLSLPLQSQQSAKRATSEVFRPLTGRLFIVRI